MNLNIFGLFLFLLAGVICNTASCPVCCKWYVVTTELQVNQTADSQVDNCTCQVTLKKLTELESNATVRESGHNCTSKELILQSGVHHVNSDNSIRSLILKLRNFNTVVIRGDPMATIKCLNQSLSLKLENVSNVKIQNIHIDKCRHIKRYFIDENVVLVTVEDRSFAIEITNSTFTDAGMTFYAFTHDKHRISGTITIEGTVVERSVTGNRAIFFLTNINRDESFLESSALTVILKNVTACYNKRTILQFTNFQEPHVMLTGKNVFSHNKGMIISGNFRARINLQFLKADVSFTHNNYSQKFIRQRDNAPIYIDGGTILLEHSCVSFISNQGAIVAKDTNITLNNNVTLTFIDNNGLPNGGAMSLKSGSTMTFNASSLRIALNFTNNRADKGGAIYVQDLNWIRPVFDFQCDPILVEMTFSNNSALYGGNHIYGGWVDWTIDSESGNISYNSAINKSLNILTNTESDISSCPVRICLCKDGHPDCNIINYSTVVYGHAISLGLAAVDQRYNPVAAHVIASLESDNPYSKEEQWHNLWPRIESLLSSCTLVTYKFQYNREIIHFKPELEACYSYVDESMDNLYKISDQHKELFKHLSIEVKSTPCPLGFILHRIERKCICDQLFGLTCDEANTMIIRKEQQWIGVTNEHTKPGEAIGVLTYSPCPFDYCRTDNHSLSIHLEDQDVVCAFNRSGILCGGCRANFSRVLGSSKCKECSNNIPVIIVIFLGQVLFGLIVVIALILLDLTVATGTINGLTFYANIIQAQHATFFTQGTAYSFLSFFIARLNLDEGIELCLYDGLDEYAITWLKIPLPLYMWLFAGVLIALSRRFSRFTRLIGKNIVQVLATLFLISYTRLLQLIIDVFSYTSLTYPDGYRKKVWYVDGNVEYFKGKHIPLFFVTVLFLSVSLPYTVILLTIQILYKISRYRLMFWVQRLKPFFDAYTGPYKAPHRYWTGLLLVVRIILLTIFSTFQSSHLPVNPLSIIIISIVLIGWLSLAKGVYESSLNNFLELMFLSNLTITSAVVLVDRQHTKVAIYISTGTALITFVCIILYHVVKQLLLTKLGSKVKSILQSIPSLIKSKTVNNYLALKQSHAQTHTAVTSTTVELKAPLLVEESY